MDAPNNPQHGKKRKKKHPSQNRQTIGNRFSPSMPNVDHKLRVPNPYDPALLERQMKCYDARVAGYSFAEISQQTGHSIKTIALDIKMETQRRLTERLTDRESRTNLQIDRYEKLKTQSLKRIKDYEADATNAVAAGNYKFAAALRSTIASEARNILEIEKALVALLGLSAPVKVDIQNNTQGAALQTALDIFAMFTPDQLVVFRERSRKAREEQAMQNVTPVSQAS